MADGSVTIDTKLNNDGFKSGLGKLGSIAKTGLKTVAVATGAVASAFAGIVTASVNARGEIEQSIGGVETLFGTAGMSLEEYAKSIGKSVDDAVSKYDELDTAQGEVFANANKAYKTAGMSANEYMQTVTGFSASLISSLKGDTLEAAKVSDMAIIDMSDNANKMGTSMEAITNAYQGFAKQNYTMLDNLKLGYGGTKTEMERLLKDAQKLTGVKYDINNLSDVYKAIHAIQNELGITGTTAKEASETLQGSFSAMKASWNNFLSGAGDLSQVVDTATDVVKNVVRIVKEAMPNIIENITNSLPEFLELGGEILQQLIQGIITYLPELMNSAGQILGSLAQGIIQTLPQLVPVVFQIIQTLITNLTNSLPQIIQMGFQVILQLATGIAQMLPTLIPQAVNCIITLVEGLLDNIDLLIDAAIELIMGLAEGLIEAIPILIEKAPIIIQKLFDALVRNFPKIVKAGGELIGKLVAGIVGSFWKLLEVAPQLISTINNAIRQGWEQMKNAGKHLIEGLWEGITGMGGWMKDKITGFAGNIVGNMKNAFGIHSPSTVFRDEVGKYLAMGVGEGFDNNISKVYRQMKSAVDFETQKLSSNLSTTASFNKILTANINVNGNVEMDSTRVGRLVAPAVSKTLRTAGV